MTGGDDNVPRGEGVRFEALFAAARLSELYPSPSRPLADPPPGSGLKPVMGDYGAPWIGYSLHALTCALPFARIKMAQYGPVTWGGLMGRKSVFVGGPEATEVVLVDREKAFSAKQGYDFLIGPFYRDGILLRDFEEHLYHRRIMQQAFTRPRLVGYLDLTTPGIVRLMGSVGQFTWPGASGTDWWADPKEDLVVVYLSAAPGPIRWHYRQKINALVYQALTD